MSTFMLLLALLSSGCVVGGEPTMELNNKCSYLAGKRILNCAGLDGLNGNLADFITETTQMILLREVKNATLHPNLHSNGNFGKITTFELLNSGTVRVSPGTFIGLKNVRHLKFNKNDWNEIDDNTFVGLQSLEVLDLDDNRIERINTYSFNHLNKLKDLILSQNRLHRIPSSVFQALNRLETLYLNSNNIETIERDALVGLDRLDMMFLTGNSLKTIEADEFSKIKNAQHLHLDFNSIESIVGSFNLPKLKFLQLNKNELDGLDEGVFSNCTELTSIDLSRNNLTNLNEKPFLPLKKLELLNLHNSMVDINKFQNLKKTVHIVY